MYEDLRKEFVKKAKDYGSTSNTFMGLINSKGPKGPQLFVIGQGPCHAAFRRFENYSTGKNLGFIWDQRLTNLKVSMDAHKAFINWITIESPMSNAFSSKGYEEVGEFGFLSNVEASKNQFITGCIASRFTTENHSKHNFAGSQRMFEKLLELGLPVGESFLFSHLFKFEGNEVTLTPLYDGHSIFNLSISQENVYRNFLNNAPKNVGVLGKAGGGTSGGSATTFFADTGGYSFYKVIEKMRPRSSRDKKDLHIFRKIKVDRVSYPPTKDGVLDIIEQIKEKVYA